MSTSIYLTIDFGSTYTKLTAIDLDKGEIVATSRAMTTVKTDVLVGFNEAFEELKKDLDKMDIDEAVVFMGHGTEHESHSSYPAIEYMFRDYGINAFVGTVEGYPELEQVIKKLKNRNIKTVDLLPFMLVAGDHAINDMASDEEDSWKTILEKEGFNVKVHVKGLGENPYIQEKFKNHAPDCMKELQEASI